MLSQVTDAMGPGQLSDMLKGLSTVTTVGSETVDGVATTHYKVSVDTSKLGSRLGARLDPSRLAGSRLPKTVTYDVWLDAGSRPVKLTWRTRTFSLELHFSKWGEPVHVVAPPASQVGSAASDRPSLPRFVWGPEGFLGGAGADESVAADSSEVLTGFRAGRCRRIRVGRGDLAGPD